MYNRFVLPSSDDDEDEFRDQLSDYEDEDEKDEATFQRIAPESHISLSFDAFNTQTQSSLDNLNLEATTREVSHVVRNIRAELRLDDCLVESTNIQRELLTLSDTITFVFGEALGSSRPKWIKSFHKRLKSAAPLDCSEPLQPWELDSFIEASILLHVYHISPEMLWSPKNVDWYRQPLMSKERYRYLQNQLSTIKSNNPLQTSSWNSRSFSVLEPDLVDCWTSLGELFRDQAYIPGVTIISLDDEKEHIRSKDVSRLGLSRSFQRAGNSGPTLRIAVNKRLGLDVSYNFQNGGESSQDCAKLTLASKLKF